MPLFQKSDIKSQIMLARFLKMYLHEKWDVHVSYSAIVKVQMNNLTVS